MLNAYMGQFSNSYKNIVHCRQARYFRIISRLRYADPEYAKIMKTRLEYLLKSAMDTLKAQGDLAADLEAVVMVERTRDTSHGDFATNLAMTLAKAAKINPRLLAEKIIGAMPNEPSVVKTEIAGPGFINFFIDPRAQFRIVQQILDEGLSLIHISEPTRPY